MPIDKADLFDHYHRYSGRLVKILNDISCYLAIQDNQAAFERADKIMDVLIDIQEDLDKIRDNEDNETPY